MTERPDTDMLAAEYVIGTLDHAERSSVAVRRLQDPTLEAAIADWETRLMPLSEHIESIEPPADLFDAIVERIAPQTSTPAPQSTILADVVQLRRSVSQWRAIAIAAIIAAAALAGLVAYIGITNGTILPQR